MASSVPPIEIGSLTAVSPNESQFIGSSSGIFFVNTVQRAFAISKAGSPRDAARPEPDASVSIETYITGVESDDNSQEHEGRITPNTEAVPPRFGTYGIDSHVLGRPPSRELAKELIQVYFRLWHPLFPFLHGPTFLKEVEAFYADGGIPTQDITGSRRKTCRAIVFQCLFNIAALDRPGLNLSSECSIKSATALTTHLCSLATRHDIPVLQALLAGQVYLIATMSLHSASTVGGMLLRLMLHGGFHRCPCRYSQLSTHDSDLRKRIFWSAYAADRYLSQALGLPLGIQDSDIDVCLPGADELHRPVSRSQRSTTAPAATEVSLHLPEGHPHFTQPRPEERLQATEISSRPKSASETSHATKADSSPDKRPGEEALAHYVSYGQLTGRALEVLHKSINVRTVQYNDVLELTSDIHSFWNALPQQLQELPSGIGRTGESNVQNSNGLGLFFTIIYQQLILLVNRPFLSVETSSLEFRLSLQTCIGASRTILSTLKEQPADFQCISWPGTLSVTWMSGLILAFACALDLYPVKKGFPEIQTCLQLLNQMGGKWSAAKHCHSALSLLLNDLSTQFNGVPSTLTTQNSNKRAHSLSMDRQPQGDPFTSDNRSKRQRPENTRQENMEPGSDKAVIDASDRNDLATVFTSSYSMALQGYNSGVHPPWAQDPDLYNTPAYAHDIFGQVSCESLFQDESYQNGFWVGYQGS